MNFNQITIYSNKLVETVEFYHKLGLTLIVDSLPRYARLEFPDGDATVEVLKKSGLQFEYEPIDKAWMWRESYLRDPNGNRICLYLRGRKSPKSSVACKIK